MDSLPEKQKAQQPVDAYVLQMQTAIADSGRAFTYNNASDAIKPMLQNLHTIFVCGVEVMKHYGAPVRNDNGEYKVFRHEKTGANLHQIVDALIAERHYQENKVKPEFGTEKEISSLSDEFTMLSTYMRDRVSLHLGTDNRDDLLKGIMKVATIALRAIENHGPELLKANKPDVRKLG